jgi:hypothetical protein
MRSTLYRLSFVLITVFGLAGGSQVRAQYCIDNLYAVGCLYGDYINDVAVGAISQTGTGCGQNGYSDYTSLAADFEQGSTNSLSVTVGNYGQYVSMWIDLNDDYEFSASEKLVSYMYCSTPGITYTASFYISPFAALGEHRMRIRSGQYTTPLDPCANYFYGEVHDYTVNITPPQDMAYATSTCTQSATDAVSLGSEDVQILGIQVITSGSLNAIDATSFTINSNGSTDFAGDVTNVKIYYTGTSAVFAANNLFGSATNLSNPITGSVELAQGVNYFWVTYDISSSGTIDNYIDAECTSVTVGGVSYTPAVTAPAGNRQLGYCTPTNQYSCYFAYIDGVELNTLSNTFSYCNGNANGYIYYEPNGNLTTSLEQGSSYSITLTGPTFEYVGFGVWIDFNNDGDFTDANEFVYSSPSIGLGTQYGSISVPTDASIGEHRMRVRCKDYGLVYASESCTSFYYGEAEDYTITITESTPMVFVSSTTAQDNTGDIISGSLNQEIISIQVVTSGAEDPFSLTSLAINANGSTNFSGDVSNVKVYYTGTNPAFGTSTLFGSSATLPATITGNQTLSAGTNYFWVAYDVKSTATLGDELDAECTQIVMTGNGGTQTPDVTAPAGSRTINYCVPTTTYGCYWGYIDGVEFNTLSNTFSGCNGNVGSYIQYDPADYTTTVEAGSTYPITLTGGPIYEYVGFGVWIDFNNNGDFGDEGEFVWSSPTATPGIQYGTVNIPSNATLGEHRMRIRSKDGYILFEQEACDELLYYYGESEDYTITIASPSSMTYVSSTATQTVTTPVSSGSADQQIIGVQVVTQGSLNPFNLTSLKINSNGTDDFAGDVTNVKIYYTGSSPVFATTTLFGSATDLTNPITGNQQLGAGNNYFWVAYDISPTALLGNYLDAECEQIVMTGNGGTQVPTITAPDGNRQINYCEPVFQYGCYFAYIDGVTLNTLTNTFSYCNGSPNGYILYPQSGNTTTELELGQNYSLQLDGPYFEAVGFGVWIDFNGDGDFDDLGEFVYGSPYYTYGSQYATLTLPCNADYVGDHRMRVRAFDYYVPNQGDACTQFYYGETEDYIITLSPPTTNQVYSASSCTQNNQNAVGKGVPDVEILGIQLTMAGCNSPLSALSFTINSTGSTDFENDVTNVKIYYTGTSSVFAPINLFGSSTDLSNPITGSQELNAGTNYFWVAYDVSGNANIGDYLDAGCTSISITGQTVTPSNSAPFGSRQINYCVPASNYGCYWGYIDDVQINTLSHPFSGCNGNFDGYVEYDQSQYTTTLQLGTTYSASLTGGPSYDYVGFGVWIDYNNDNDFDDPDEFVWGSPAYANGVQNFTFTVPNNPDYSGDRRLRIRSKEYSTMTAADACTYFLYYYGEAEDYTITLEPPPACTTTPTAGTVSADPIVVCEAGGSTTMELIDYSIAGDLSFRWQSSTDGINYSNISGATSTTYTATLSASTYYRVKVTCDNTNESAFTDGLQIKVGGNESITSSTGATICGEGNVTVNASGNGDYVLWYESESDIVPVYSSSSPSDFTSYVNATTTYYAATAIGSINNGHVGPVDNSIGITNQYFTYAYQNFTVFKPCTIVGVYVYPASAGDVQLYLWDANYYTIETTTVEVTADDVGQKTWIPLNWNCAATGSYHLAWGYSSVNLYSNDYNPSGYPYPYVLDDVLSITGSAYGSYYYLYAYDWVVDYSQLCVSPKVPVTITATPSPEITVSPDPSSATICAGSGESVDLSVSGGSYNTFVWSPADGLSSTTGATVSATPATNTAYTVLASNATCANADTIYVYVSDPPVVTATASPDAVCAGGSSQLFASTPATNYSVYEIDFNPEQSNAGIPVALFDESYSSALPLGFTFNFYGNDYSQFYISGNGWLSFTQPYYAGCCQGQFLPNSSDPNNLLAFCWEDLNPGIGGTVMYWTSGTAPFRKCVVEFKDVQHYYSGDPVTVQAILYETTNVIEVHTTTMPGNPSGYWAPHTLGIENIDGTIGLAVPGRNADATWTASNDAWRFAPQELQYSWSPSGTLDNPNVVNPIATPNSTTTYTATVTDANTLCATTASVTVSLVTTPVAGTITPDLSEFCGQADVALTAMDYSPGATLQWQQASSPGGPYTDIPGATQTEYTTPAIDNTTYYVVKATCQGSATSDEATVVVNEAPDDPVAINGGNCGPGEVILGAEGTGQGDLYWYYSPDGSNFLGTGSPFTTPYINETTTFYVSEGELESTPLTTTLNGFYSSSGNMFDIVAKNDVYITGFDITMSSFYTADIEVYFKPGSYSGYEYSPSSWTLLGTASNITGGGSGVAVPLNLQLFAHIPAGTSGAFYITCANYYVTYLSNQYGTGIGNVYVQDDNIQVKEGVSNYYAFGYPYGPYVFGGKVRYVAPGCSSPLTPVLAEIYQPQVTATVSAAEVCEGTSIELIATNFGSGNFQYEWMPQIPGMDPQNGMNDTVSVTPPVSMTFTVSVSDPNAPLCDTMISIPVVVNPTPGVFISNLDPQYYENEQAFVLDGVPAGGTFSGPGVTGNQFNPSSLPIGGPYTITYTYTDANGCTGTYSQDVYIVPIEGIGEVGLDYSISFYPNPSEGVFNMSIDLSATAEEVELTLYDVIGKEVLRKDFGFVQGQVVTTFDCSSWAKGTYFARVAVDGKHFYRKITLQ